MKKILFLGKRFAVRIAVACVICTAFFSCSRQNSAKDRYFESMNTYMKVRCYGKKAARANAAAQKTISDLESLLSVTKPTSDLARLNTANGEPVKVNSATLYLTDFALDMADFTSGALNPALYPVIRAWGFTTKQYRVPDAQELSELLALCNWRSVKLDRVASTITLKPGMMLDFGAVGKGFAGDAALDVFRSYGIKSAMVDLGGNVQVLGKKPDGSAWQVGIRSPYGDGVAAVIAAEDCAVITSGGYERFFVADGKRYIHIFDGTTGTPVQNGMLSATIITQSGLYADSLSTAAFVMGAQKTAELWRQNEQSHKKPSFDFVLFTDDGTAWITARIQKKLTLSDDFFYVKVVE